MKEEDVEYMKQQREDNREAVYLSTVLKNELKEWCDNQGFSLKFITDTMISYLCFSSSFSEEVIKKCIEFFNDTRKETMFSTIGVSINQKRSFTSWFELNFKKKIPDFTKKDHTYRLVVDTIVKLFLTNKEIRKEILTFSTNEILSKID